MPEEWESPFSRVPDAPDATFFGQPAADAEAAARGRRAIGAAVLCAVGIPLAIVVLALLAWLRTG